MTATANLAGGVPQPRTLGQVALAPALVLLAAAALVAAALVGRIAQDPDYHRFADVRALLGIPNAADVLSNLAFLAAGAAGLAAILRRRAAFVEARERWPWIVLFAGVVVVAFGSAWYHLAPSNETLVWDRAPMAIAFMALLSAVIAERVGTRAGIALLVPLVAAGIASVAFWYATEAAGAGDLRPYVIVQAYPFAAIAILLLAPPRYGRTWELLASAGAYGLAKAAEVLDRAIFEATGAVSGHTLKHLLAAAGVALLAHMLVRRRPMASA